MGVVRAVPETLGRWHRNGKRKHMEAHCSRKTLAFFSTLAHVVTLKTDCLTAKTQFQMRLTSSFMFLILVPLLIIFVDSHRDKNTSLSTEDYLDPWCHRDPRPCATAGAAPLAPSRGCLGSRKAPGLRNPGAAAHRRASGSLEVS